MHRLYIGSKYCTYGQARAPARYLFICVALHCICKDITKSIILASILLKGTVLIEGSRRDYRMPTSRRSAISTSARTLCSRDLRFCPRTSSYQLCLPSLQVENQFHVDRIRLMRPTESRNGVRLILGLTLATTWPAVNYMCSFPVEVFPAPQQSLYYTSTVACWNIRQLRPCVIEASLAK